MFGIFEHHICDVFQHLPIFRGFDDVFYVPHSRHTEVRREDIEKCEGRVWPPIWGADFACSCVRWPAFQ